MGRYGIQIILLLILTLTTAAVYAYPVRVYAILNGGYGSYQAVNANDGGTGVIRIGLGTSFSLQHHLLIGGEAAIQTGNRMRLSASTTAVFGPNAMPVFITVRPPIDLLLTAGYRLTEHLSLIGKVGVAYLNVLVDNVTIANLSQNTPEAQVGLSWNISKRANLDIDFQQYFGSRPILSNVNLEQGTAVLNNLPTWQAIFIGVDVDLFD